MGFKRKKLYYILYMVINLNEFKCGENIFYEAQSIHKVQAGLLVKRAMAIGSSQFIQ